MFKKLEERGRERKTTNFRKNVSYLPMYKYIIMHFKNK